MTIEEFIAVQATNRAASLEAITSALFHAEMDRRGTGPGCASFGSVWSRSESSAARLLTVPSAARELADGERRAIASIWSDHPEYQQEWSPA